jgi:hypothetical protein
MVGNDSADDSTSIQSTEAVSQLRLAISIHRIKAKSHTPHTEESTYLDHILPLPPTPKINPHRLTLYALISLCPEPPERGVPSPLLSLSAASPPRYPITIHRHKHPSLRRHLRPHLPSIFTHRFQRKRA